MVMSTGGTMEQWKVIKPPRNFQTKSPDGQLAGELVAGDVRIYVSISYSYRLI